MICFWGKQQREKKRHHPLVEEKSIISQDIPKVRPCVSLMNCYGGKTRTFLHNGMVEYRSGCVQIDTAGCASWALAQEVFPKEKESKFILFCMFPLTHSKKKDKKKTWDVVLWIVAYRLYFNSPTI